MSAPRIPAVFISSTAEDLRLYRAAAENAAKSARFLPAMQEYFVASGNPPLDECARRVIAADVLVVIVAQRYGWVPDDQPEGQRRSITWLECDCAASEGKEVLAFVLEDHAEWPIESADDYALNKAARAGALTPELVAQVQRNLDGLRDFRTWLNSRAIRATFRNPDDLGRKVSDALREWRDRHPEFRVSTVRMESSEPDSSHYLEYLREETGYIEIRGLQSAEGKAYRFPIGELYIPLMDEQAGPEGGKTDGKPLPLAAALSHQRLVIVGDPGSGKTTFLRRIANERCQALLASAAAPLPVLLRANELADFIRRERDDANARAPVAPDAPIWLVRHLGRIGAGLNWGLRETDFHRRLDQGTCQVLLDGLDEAPTKESRETISRLVDQAAKRWPKCAFVVTTRPQAYEGDVVLAGFDHARIGGLERPDVRLFLERWSAALHPGNPARALRHAEELTAAVESRTEIRRMARNPVMLTALAVLHWNEKRLPEQRSDLYESVLMWLARSRKRRPDRATPERCIALLQELAWAMQSNPKGRQVQAPRGWAAQTLAPRFREAAGEEERLERAKAFLVEEELDSGIIVKRGTEVRFWHLTFQEHLAARALAALPEAERHRVLFDDGKAEDPEWREVLSLAAGILHQQRAENVDALVSAILDQWRTPVRRWLGLKPGLADRARCLRLIGIVTGDLERLQYRVTDPRYEELKREFLGIFDPVLSEGIAFQARLAAAEALGQAGDPRLRDPRSDADYWVRIPAGTFWMGAQKDDPNGRNYDPEAYDDEAVREVTLNTFEIGRYPVTVEEYQRFIDEGGYSNRELWKAGGFGDQAEPDNWDKQQRHPSRPVVNVTWYEASAYCAWAGGRLPAEAEWERAARGLEGRRYPWGDAPPDPTRANYNETKVGRPTPVGLFPKGATPDGIHDLAGNVLEWTADRYDAENYVIRGGSWVSSARVLRVSYRLRDVPQERNDNLGFRCVRELLSL